MLTTISTIPIKRSYYGIRNMSDKLCRENGLSVVVPGKGSKGKSYAEYQAEKAGTSWKGKLKIAVDTLIPQVASFEELLQRLQAAGYEIKPEHIPAVFPEQLADSLAQKPSVQIIQRKQSENGLQASAQRRRKLLKSNAAYRCLSTLKTVSKHKRAGAMSSGRKSII